MSMPPTVRAFLERQSVSYTAVRHERSDTGTEAAELAHVSGNRVIKGVLIGYGEEYRVVALPVTRHLDIPLLQRRLAAPWALAREGDIVRCFPDCETGRVPVPATAYGIDVLIDKSIEEAQRVYVEVGDATTLARMETGAFLALFPAAPRGEYSRAF